MMHKAQINFIYRKYSLAALGVSYQMTSDGRHNLRWKSLQLDEDLCKSDITELLDPWHIEQIRARLLHHFAETRY